MAATVVVDVADTVVAAVAATVAVRRPNLASDCTRPSSEDRSLSSAVRHPPSASVVHRPMSTDQCGHMGPD